MSTVSADVIVVGAGLAGAASAWALAGRGRDVVVLERFARGHVRGSSHGTERIVRLGYTDRTYVELGLEAIRGWRTLEDDAGTRLLHVTGAVDHGDADELAAIVGAYEGCGVGYEWLPPDAAKERWAGLRFEGPVLHQPDGGWVQADAALDAFLWGAARRGAEVLFEQPVATLEAAGDRVRVVTADRAWAARAVVVAAGSWAPSLLGDQIALPPITVTQEQIAYVRPTDPSLTWPCFIHRAVPLHYGLPTLDGRVKVGDHGTGPVVDPDQRTFEPNPEAWARLLAAFPHWFPGLQVATAESSTCLYASTPTDDFVLDRRGPIVVAAGFGGHGFKFGPAIGRIVADLVDGQAGPAQFSLDRPSVPASTRLR